MKITQKNKAFSLIELSIVILIIGIIIAGITQGSRVVSQMKIASAKSQTQSAPVSSISGLAIWLEPTLDTSFPTSSQIEDGSNVTTWRDINPQSTSKNNVTRGSSTSAITYKISGINNVPCVYFAGTAAGTAAYLTGSAIQSSSNAFTLLAVFKSDDVSGTSQLQRSLVLNGSAGDGWNIRQSSDSTAKRLLSFSSVNDSTGTATMTLSPEVLSIAYDGTTLTMYVNGASSTISTPTGTMTAPATGLIIGGHDVSTGIIANTVWKGCIGEIIIYDHALKSEERKSVEKYLGKKWGIGVS